MLSGCARKPTTTVSNPRGHAEPVVPCVVRGAPGAVETALEIARRTAGQYGEFVAAHAIPFPYDTLEARLPHG